MTTMAQKVEEGEWKYNVRIFLEYTLNGIMLFEGRL